LIVDDKGNYEFTSEGIDYYVNYILVEKEGVFFLYSKKFLIKE